MEKIYREELDSLAFCVGRRGKGREEHITLALPLRNLLTDGGNDDSRMLEKLISKRYSSIF